MRYMVSYFFISGVMYIIGYIIVILSGNVIDRVLSKFNLEDVESLPEAGKIIGILERIIIITLVYLEKYDAIAIIIAAKSIIRFERTKDNMGSSRKFAEYFLIGTFLSLIIAVFTGIFITLVNRNMPHLLEIFTNFIVAK